MKQILIPNLQIKNKITETQRASSIVQGDMASKTSF